MKLSPGFRQWLRRGRFALGLLNLAAFVAFFALTPAKYGGGDPRIETAIRYLPKVVKSQFLPAVLSLDLIVLGAIVVATFLFGRIYCEAVCPLGVAQDVIRKAACVKRLSVRRVCAKLPVPWYQWIFRLAIVAAFVAGGLLGVGFWTLDPYAIFCRAAALIHMPELLDVTAAASADAYATVRFPLLLATMAGPFLAVAVLALFGKGRLWCNWICPVGTVFALATKLSVVDSQFEKSCGECRACMKKQLEKKPAVPAPAARVFDPGVKMEIVK